MSISKIFWIDEYPIREHVRLYYPQIIEEASLSRNSSPVSFSACKSLKIRKIVGQHFWDLIPEAIKIIDNLSIKGNRTENDLSLSNCFHFDKLDYESSELWFFMWDRNKLQRLSYGYKNNVFCFTNTEDNLFFTKDTLLKLRTNQDGAVYNGLSYVEKEKIAGQQLVWNNQLALKGAYSIYWFFINTFNRQPKSPSYLSVGDSLLNFIFSDWNKTIGCFNRASTITESNVVTFFIWKGNCLRNIDKIEDEELIEIEDYIKGVRK